MSNKPNKIIVHHSYRPEDSVLFSEFDAITRYYTEQHEPPYSDNPYHYGIEYVQGELVVKKGRDEDTVGAHAYGQNSQSIGIVFIGNFNDKIPSDEMLMKGAELIAEIHSRRGDLPIYGHRHFSTKTCPGTHFPLWKLKEMVEDVKNPPHWAEKHYESLLEKGWQISEKRYDDAITRGEMFALLDKNTEVM